jgi:hypothetical protein
MTSAAVTITLTHDKALVLFEWLTRREDRLDELVDDQAEQVALCNLTCLLESQVAEVFDPDYGRLVQQAMDRLRQAGSGPSHATPQQSRGQAG